MLGLGEGSYFSADTHWFNIELMNQPGLLARVLCVVAHHNANVESVRVDRLFEGERSRAVLKISLPEELLERVQRKLSRVIGVLTVEVIASPILPPEDPAISAGGSASR